MKVEDWGLVEYGLAVDRQLSLVEEVAAGGEELLVFCTHPSVVTVGRAPGAREDLLGWSGPIYESARGGRVTYHGPNQIVIYPIVDLRRPRAGLTERDVHAYLRLLERATVAAVAGCGLTGAEARTARDADGHSLTGVWVGPKKIASIGIAVRKWVTYHGVAVNFSHDPSAFVGIRPCGFDSRIMASVETEIGQPPSPSAFKTAFHGIFNGLVTSQD